MLSLPIGEGLLFFTGSFIINLVWRHRESDGNVNAKY